MSSASSRCSLLAGEIQALLGVHAGGGLVFPACSIATSAGVKLADVVWASMAFVRRHGTANPDPEAPEIVVEVPSDATSRAELDEEKGLYLARGTREWLCPEEGEMTSTRSTAR